MNSQNNNLLVTIIMCVALVAAAILTVPSSVLQVSYAQMNQDLANEILAVHNRERTAVGVSPLTWNDNLAADAQTWAQHISTTGQFIHDPESPGGENIAGFNPSMGVSAPGEGQSLWVDEKQNWQGGVLTPENWYPTGHYTQMVWKDTQEVGCGTASGDGHPFSILVCRYNPNGNFMGQAPY